MAVPSDPQLTRLLEAWRAGDSAAADKLVPLVYAELRRIAASKLRSERGGHTLQPTALVNEAWLRLMKQHDSGWQNRAQFFAIAAQAMRRILVDHARKRHAAKRGDGEEPADIDEVSLILTVTMPDERLLALDDALKGLATLDARQARIVELRFFGGLSVEETASVLEISPTTVKREWATGRAWLFRAINGDSATGGTGL
jgi:RNA polymerase sigma factor (TIGR02999 family)